MEGDWPELFGAPSRRLRAVFLGDPAVDFFVDVDATLQRLEELKLGGAPRRVAQPTPYGPLAIATVRDPDGAMVLLTPGSITRSR